MNEAARLDEADEALGNAQNNLSSKRNPLTPATAAINLQAYNEARKAYEVALTAYYQAQKDS